MKCPACENLIQNNKSDCTFCGWRMADDVTIYSTLFTEIQLREYGEMIESHRRMTRTQEEASKRESEVPSEMVQASEISEQKEPENGSVLKTKSVKQDRVKETKDANALEPRIPEGDERIRTEWMMENMRHANGTLGGLNLHHTLGLPIGVDEDTSEARKRLVQEICSRIADGSFEDLHVGDYFYVTLSNKEKLKLVLAGFGTDLRRLKPEFAGKMKGFVDVNGERVNNYAWVVPEHCLQKKEPMQKVGLFERPSELVSQYEDSYIYEEILPEYAKMLQKELDNRIVRYEPEQELELLSHEMLYGDYSRYYEGLPLFVLDPEAREVGLGIKGKQECSYWLRDKGQMGFLSNKGNDVLPYTKLGVRPYFRIG